MKKVSLSGSPRESVGKKDAAALRAQGRVPAVLYGGESQTHFSVDLIELSKYVYTADVFRFKIDIAGTVKDAILKDLQFDPVSDRIIHIDFLEIIEDKPLKMELPVHLRGNAIGVRNGGRLSSPFRRLQVMGLAKDFPEAIEIDITDLRIGQSIRIADLNYPNVKLLHNDSSVVVGIRTARGAVEDAPAAEAEGEEEEEAATAEGETTE